MKATTGQMLSDRREGPIVGTAMLVTLTISDDWPDQLKHAWQTRRTGILTGRCPECRQRVKLQYEGRSDGSRLILDHSHDCTGDEGAALRMLEDWLATRRACPHGDPTCPYERDDRGMDA